MFTGIITHIGIVTKKSKTDLTIKTDRELMKKLSVGASISVNGICLTVIKTENDTFSINFMPETEKKTTIQYLKQGVEVNLELPATANSLLSGHIVQGHVDAIGEITSIKKEGNSYILTITILQSLNKYLVEKGSISVNGISLTLISVDKTEFTIGIIPHTWKQTMLHAAKTGDYVNLEVDTLAKYIEKLIQST